MRLYIGTYAERGSQGIYTAECENGRFGEPSVFAHVNDPKYLAAGEYLYAVGSSAEGCGVMVYAYDGTPVSQSVYEAGTSCYIVNDGKRIYTANYHEGTVSTLIMHGKEISLDRQLCIREKAGCHQVIPYGDVLYVPALLDDCVYVLDQELTVQHRILFPKGSGPRHGMIYDRYLYMVSELSCQLYRVDLSTYAVTDMRKIGEGTAAAIRLYDGHLYISVRETNEIVTVSVPDMKVIGRVFSGGDHPRDILVCDGWLYTANRYSDEVNVRRIGEDHLPEEIRDRIHIPGAVSIIAV